MLPAELPSNTKGMGKDHFLLHLVHFLLYFNHITLGVFLPTFARVGKALLELPYFQQNVAVSLDGRFHLKGMNNRQS